MSIAIGVLLGVVIVVLFLGSTPLLLGRLIGASTAASPLTALVFFFVKALAALAVLVLLLDVGGLSEHVNLTAFGLAAVATSFSWTGWQLQRFRHDRTPTYDLGEDDH